MSTNASFKWSKESKNDYKRSGEINPVMQKESLSSSQLYLVSCPSWWIEPIVLL